MQKKYTPLISIVIPVYNKEQSIERCLQSCLNQNFFNYEIIIIDDAGTDNSITKIQPYICQNKHISLHHHAYNQGTYHARKNGVYQAKGDFILFLDPDDELTGECLNTIANNLLKKDTVDILFFALSVHPSPKPFDRKFKPIIGEFTGNQIIHLCNQSTSLLGAGGKVFRRQLLIDAYRLIQVPQDKKLIYGEDILTFAATLPFSPEVLSIPNKLYIYHKNHLSITQQYDIQSINHKMEQLLEIRTYISVLAIQKINSHALHSIQKLLRTDQIKLKLKTPHSKRAHLRMLIQLFYTSRSIVSLIKLGIFLISFGLIIK